MSRAPISEELVAQAINEWLTPGGAAVVLESALGADLTIEGVTVCSYVPRRRALFKVAVTGDGDYALKFRRQRAEQIFHDWQALAGSALGFQVPRPLAFLAGERCIVYRWAEGSSFRDGLRLAGAQWVHVAGGGISALHRSTATLSQSFDVHRVLKRLSKRVGEASKAGHPRISELRQAFAELAKRSGEGEQPLSPGHLNLNPSQLLATIPVTFLDLDVAAMCELPLTVGTFAAELALDGFADLVEPLLATTVGHRPDLRRRADLYRLTALVHRSAVDWLRGEKEKALAVPLQ
jgi:hypothetical protein